MKFTEEPPRTWLGRKDQLRMITLLGGLIVIFALMQHAAQPQTWYWLTGAPAEDAVEVDPAAEPGEANYAPSSLAADEFFSPTEKPTTRQPVSAPRPGSEPGVVTVKNTDDAQAAATPETEIAGDGKPQFRFLGLENQIDSDVFSGVADSTPLIRPAEREAYYQVLAHVSVISEKTREKLARRGVAYVDLTTQPERYRGMLMHIQGELRALYKLPSAANDYGVSNLYEAWIQPSDGDTMLYRVVCKTPPSDVAIGTWLPGGVDVETRGYFFKLYGYERDSGGSQIAPLILSDDLTLIPREVGMEVPDDDGSWVAWTLGIGLALLMCVAGFIVFRTQRGDRKFDQEHKRRVFAATEEELEGLSKVPSQTTDEFLGELQKQAED